jgi:hypothetical protein
MTRFLREHIDFTFVALVISIMVCLIALGVKNAGTHKFTAEQCTTAPTGRMHKNVVAVQADEGKPVGVVETVTAIEYMTMCEKSEWRE